MILPKKVGVHACLISLFATSCTYLHVPEETLIGSAWKTDGIATSNKREAIFPELNFPELKKRDNLGVCFSGGGNRSAVATLGQLRGLYETGIIDRARYVSAVSGGAWGAAPWVYLKESVANDETFLGPYVAPGDLTESDLTTVPAGSFAATLSDKTIGLRRTLFRNHGDENFAVALREVFLKDWELADKNKFTAYRVEDAQRMVEKNRGFNNLGIDDFQICRKDRPYLIINAAISLRHRKEYEEYFRPIEFTPNYSGSRGYQQGRGGIYRIVETSTGGGFVDNTVYDVKPRRVEQTGVDRFRVEATSMREYPYSWRLDPRLSLSDMMAATGSAPTVKVPYLTEILGFPQFYHTSPANFPAIDTEELTHTDGGSIDNLGITSLLARGVTKIIAFANTSDLYTKPDETKKDEFAHCRPTALAQYFGVGPDVPATGAPIYDSGTVRNMHHSRMNYVFSNKNGELNKMQEQFDRQSETGQVLYHSDVLTTVENKYHGIEGGQKVRVCFFLLGPKFNAEESQPELGVSSGGNIQRTKWASQIKDETTRNLFGTDVLKDFPHYATFSQNGFSFLELFSGVKVINLEKIQVNALAHYTSYQVVAYEDEIRSFLDL